jgi:site-specific recombinase XerD
MVELSKKLMQEHPEGPLFRSYRKFNGQRKPWSRNGIRCRFKRLREKHPELRGIISYTLRHTFATDALANGVPVATVAELMGHQDLKMLQQHYAHLAEKTEHLRKAAEQATRKA